MDPSDPNRKQGDPAPGLEDTAAELSHDPLALPATQVVTIGRYHVVRLLQRGGMGEVYLARDPVLDRELAVKVIASELEDESARRRFIGEARAAGRLRHPNIVTIFDAGEHEGRPYIAMEYVPGETFRSLIRRRAALSLARRLELIEGACAGLAHAHAAGVVHLDIKPDNLMVDSSGVVKVLDFGIARVLEGGAHTTRHLLGTLRYMSPEQMVGGPLDYKCDVFSLGCSLYELVAYAPAFEGSTHEIITRIEQGPVPRLLEVIPALDPRLDAIVARAMAVERSERYDSLEDLRVDVAHCRAELEAFGRSAMPAIDSNASTRVSRDPFGAGTPPPDGRRTAGAWWRHRGGAAVAAGALVAAATFAYFTGALTPSNRPATPNPIAVPSSSESERPSQPAAPQDAAVTGQPTPLPTPTARGRQTADSATRSAAPDARGTAGLRARETPSSPSTLPSTVVSGNAGAIVPPAPPAVAGPQAESPRPSDQTPPGDRTGSTESFDRAQGRPDKARGPSDSDAILDTLRRYEAAYESLDASRVLEVFPALGRDQVEQLRASFARMTAYRIEIQNPRVEVHEADATAYAVVERHMTPRVGRPVTNAVNSEFHLRRDGSRWVVTAVDAR
jgi:serine/threonine-protein kinase